MVTVLDELIERHGPLVGALLPLRRGLALAPTVRPSEFVHAAHLVEDSAADTQARVAFEGDPALRLEPVYGVDQPNERGGLQVVRTRDCADRHVHPVRDAGGERHVALDECTTRRGLAFTTDLVEVPPLTARRCANCARGGPGG